MGKHVSFALVMTSSIVVYVWFGSEVSCLSIKLKTLNDATYFLTFSRLFCVILLTCVYFAGKCFLFCKSRQMQY